MKKVLAILLIMFVLVGCGNTASNNDSEGTSSSNVGEGNASSEENAIDKSTFAGTYIGLHGSGITLFSNGGAEYYWKEWTEVETGDTWEYGDSKLTLHSRNLGYDIYADVENGNTASLNFKGVGDTTWEDEMFVKISDDINSKDVDGYIALIEKQLNITLEKPSEFVQESYNGFTFVVPGTFKKENMNDGILFSDEGNNAGIMIPSVIDSNDYSESEKQQFRDRADEYLDWLINKYLEHMVGGITLDSEDVKVISIPNDKLLTKSAKYSFADLPWIVTAYFDEESCNRFMTVYLYKSEVPEIEDIYYKIVASVSYGEKTDDSSSTAENQKSNTDNTSNGSVSPDLKEFLDSYEAYIDEYVEFMKKYYENPTDLKMIADYAEMLQKYTDLTAAAEKYKSDDMSNEDLAYYMDVMNRCNKKILEITN